MNQRNVEALTMALEAAFKQWRPVWGSPGAREPTDAELAELLAEKGVLCPEALTDKQCAKLTKGWDDQYYYWGSNVGEGSNIVEGAAEMRGRLVRFAKGVP